MAEAMSSSAPATTTSAASPSSPAPSPAPVQAAATADAKTQSGGKPAAKQAATVATAATKSDATQAVSAQTPEAVTPGADAAKQVSAPVEQAKPTEPAKDEVAEVMARLNREQREIAKEKRKIEASSKELGEKAKLGEALVSARDLLGKKDFLGALTALAGESGLDVDEAAVLLFEQASSREKPALTEKDIERIAEEKLKAKEEAERKAFEERNNAEMAQGKALYGNACAQIFKADPSKFPMIATYGLDDEQMFNWVLPETKKNRGAPPAPMQTLEYFEAKHRAKFEKAAAAMGYVKAAPQLAPSPAPATAKDSKAQIAPAADSGGSVTVGDKPKRETLKEYNERVKAQFRARRQQSA